MTPALLPLWDGKWDNGEEGPLQPGKRGQGRGAGQRWPQTAASERSLGRPGHAPNPPTSSGTRMSPLLRFAP